MFNIIHQLKPKTTQLIVKHLNKHKDRLKPDVSAYARGRQRYWLQKEWRLDKKCYQNGIKDKRLWTFCKAIFPEADLGLVVYGDIGIKVHRDGWYYDNQYPNFSWSKKTNPSSPEIFKVKPGDIFEFNTKNPHAAIKPQPDRWAIFLWKKKV